MRGKRHADGIEIDQAHAQAGDIVHFVGNSPEISAEKVVSLNDPVFVRRPVHVLVPSAVDGVGLELAGEVAAAAAVEAVREDLIDHRALRPVRRGEIRADAADLPQTALLHIGVVPLLEQAEHAVHVVDLEIIEVQSGGEEGKFPLVNVIVPPLLPAEHLQVPGGTAVFITQHDLRPPGAHGGWNVHMQCAPLPRAKAPKGCLKLRLLAVKQDPHDSFPS